VDASRIEQYRKGLKILKKGLTYLNHANVGPLHDDVVSAVRQTLMSQAEQASLAQIKWFEILDQARHECASFLRTTADSIAILPNTSTGIIRALSSLPLVSGDEVVYLEGEFPALYWPLMGLKRLKAKLVAVRANKHEDLTEAVLSRINSRTRLVALSWVDFFTGARVDIKALESEKKRRGFHLLVDGMQAVGCLPVQLSELPIDFMAVHGAKWLMAPVGVGLLYASEEARKLTPDFHGWYGHEIDWSAFLRRDTPLYADARKFETGSPPFSLINGLTSAVSNLSHFGSELIWNRVNRFTTEIIRCLREMEVDILTPTESEKRAGIVTFKHAKVNEIFAQLQKRSIIVSVREGAIRVSPHFWNTGEEIQRFIEVVRNVVKGA